MSLDYFFKNLGRSLTGTTFWIGIYTSLRAMTVYGILYYTVCNTDSVYHICDPFSLNRSIVNIVQQVTFSLAIQVFYAKLMDIVII
jgi:hypothetical protein